MLPDGMVLHNMETPSNIVSWSDIDRLSRSVADKLPAVAGVAAFDRVIGISRGGLIPAVLIGSHLQIKRIESAQVRFYDGDKKLSGPILVGAAPSPCGPSGDPCRTLIVDEILDSGSTMNFLRRLFPEATLAALVTRHTDERPSEDGGLLSLATAPWEGVSTHVWVAESLETERWILFPWSPPEDLEAARLASDGRAMGTSSL